MSSDFYAQVISGAVSVDEYDEFVAKWDKAGGAEMTEEINAWYAEFNK